MEFMNESLAPRLAHVVLQHDTLPCLPSGRHQHRYIIHFIVLDRRDPAGTLLQGCLKTLLRHTLPQHPHFNGCMIGAQPVVQLHIAATTPVGGQVDQASAQGPGAHMGGHFAHVDFLLFAGLLEGGAGGEGAKHQACKKHRQPTHRGLLAFAAILMSE
ncbi:hypothetical protein D3C85_895890 [compost metagenome]